MNEADGVGLYYSVEQTKELVNQMFSFFKNKILYVCACQNLSTAR